MSAPAPMASTVLATVSTVMYDSEHKTGLILSLTLHSQRWDRSMIILRLPGVWSFGTYPVYVDIGSTCTCSERADEVTDLPPFFDVVLHYRWLLVSRWQAMVRRPQLVRPLKANPEPLKQPDSYIGAKVLVRVPRQGMNPCSNIQRCHYLAQGSLPT